MPVDKMHLFTHVIFQLLAFHCRWISERQKQTKRVFCKFPIFMLNFRLVLMRAPVGGGGGRRVRAKIVCILLANIIWCHHFQIPGSASALRASPAVSMPVLLMHWNVGSEQHEETLVIYKIDRKSSEGHDRGLYNRLNKNNSVKFW